MTTTDDQSDLFGLDRAMTPAERKRLHRQTRSKKRGHAAAPGTGPAGETCGTCEHLHRSSGHSRNWFKCWLMHGKWTSSYGTDIRFRDAACGKWEAKADDKA